MKKISDPLCGLMERNGSSRLRTPMNGIDPPSFDLKPL